MLKRTTIRSLLPFIAGICLVLHHPVDAAVNVQDSEFASQRACLDNDWLPLQVEASGRTRSLLWKASRRKWQQGAIIILHGGGGSHHQFCTGGKLVQPQISFAEQAVADGFAVFLLDATTDVVTDKKGKTCGKRFDFSVLDRPNVDLPFIGKMIKRIIPQLRSNSSSKKIFLTGLSTGGSMAIRAATHFDRRVTAVAPVSAADPYGTEMNCDTGLSSRQTAKGVLQDLETGKRITARGACKASAYPNEKPWDTQRAKQKPVFRQFHNRGDAIVDLSCMEKAQKQLEAHGYKNAGAVILESKQRRALNHLWLRRYNDDILEFFKSQ